MGKYLQEVGVTLALPMVTFAGSIYHSKVKTKLITIIALAIILSIPQVRNALSEGYHCTVSFLSNPTHAGLIGGLLGAIYLAVGRELLNKHKFVLTQEESDEGCANLKINGKSYFLIPVDVSTAKTNRLEGLLVEVEDDDYVFSDESYNYSPPMQEQESLCQKLAKNEGVLTLTLPVTAPIATMCQTKRNIAITVVALAIMIALATGPAHHKDFLQGYKIVAKFMSNPIHAGLVSGIAGVAYIAIGRELLIRKKFSIKDDRITIKGVEYSVEEVEISTERLTTHMSDDYDSNRSDDNGYDSSNDDD